MNSRIEADRRKSRTGDRRAEWSSRDSDWFERAFEARDPERGTFLGYLEALKDGIRLAIRMQYETTHETVLEPSSPPVDPLLAEVMSIPAEEDMPF